MRVVLRDRTPGRIEFGIIYGSITLIALVLAYLLPVLDVFPPCVFRQLSGLPCPTCGATHAVVLFSRGALLDALKMNPLIILSVMIVLGYFVYSIVAIAFGLRQVAVLFSQTDTRIFRLGIILVLALNWAYLISFFR